MTSGCLEGRNELNRDTVIIIAGPTASGKSVLAMALAEHHRGTVINADALQCYRDLRILTARPGAADEARAPHRLYGFLDAAARGSAASWRGSALGEIAASLTEGRLPILVGGTGLYLRALREGLADVPDIPMEIREEAVALFARLGGDAFRAELTRLDPVSAERFPPGDKTRLTRAYEVARATGKPIGVWQSYSAKPAPYRFATILLAPPRAALYAACDARFAAMIDNGGLNEAAALLGGNLSPDLPVMKAVGLPELFRHLRGDIPLEAAIAAAQQATRRYAKRQMTWFRHQLNAELTCVEQYSESFCLTVRHFIDHFLLTREA
jgi:tRNA dimethylallyltransferase